MLTFAILESSFFLIFHSLKPFKSGINKTFLFFNTLNLSIFQLFLPPVANQISSLKISLAITAVFSLSTITTFFNLSINKCSPNKHCPNSNSLFFNNLCTQHILLNGVFILFPVLESYCIIFPVLILSFTSICQKIVAPYHCFDVPIRYLIIKSFVTSTPKSVFKYCTKLFSSYFCKEAWNFADDI